MMDFSNEAIDFIREQLLTAREQTKTAKIKLDEATKAEKTWGELSRFVSFKWYLHILDLLDKQTYIFKKIVESNPRIVSILEEMRLSSKTSSDEIMRRYPTYLEEAFRKMGFPLDPESRHPRYSFANGFFRLEIDEKTRTAKLSDNEGRLAELPADIDAILEVVQREHKRIFGRSYVAKEFLRRLRGQYLAIIKKDGFLDGTSVPIRRITSRMGKNIERFRTDEFLADLSRLVELGPLEVEGRRLDLQQTKDTNQGMLLHGAAGRGYIGFIVFKEV